MTTYSSSKPRLNARILEAALMKLLAEFKSYKLDVRHKTEALELTSPDSWSLCSDTS